jgi:hypothetical protein
VPLPEWVPPWLRRVIERTEHQAYIDKNRRTVARKEQLYKRRQAIVEHPFGVMKRQWGFYFMLSRKGMHRASADVGLIFTAYNLRRILSILGPDMLKSYFKGLQKAILALFWPFWRRCALHIITVLFGKNPWPRLSTKIFG